MVKPELPTNIEATACRALLPGMEYALESIIQELNQVREKLGSGPLQSRGWSGKSKKGGITVAGRKKLSEMMQARWQQAYAEGKHVTEIRSTGKSRKKRGSVAQSAEPNPAG